MLFKSISTRIPLNSTPKPGKIDAVVLDGAAENDLFRRKV